MRTRKSKRKIAQVRSAVTVVFFLGTAALLSLGFERALAQSQRTRAANSPKQGATHSAGVDKKPAGDTAASGGGEKIGTLPGSGRPSAKALVTAVRFLSSKGTTRITVDLSQEASYELRGLREDSAKHLPPRIYVDILGARLAASAKEGLQINDGLLSQVRVAQYSPDVVRLVLDLQSATAHNAFMLTDPYRLIIDVAGEIGAKRPSNKESGAKVEAANRNSAMRTVKSTPSPALTSGLRKIVLDPGHGGKDPGAIGPGGIAEKDIVLSIAKKLALKITAEMGAQVVLTRKDDRFVALEDRTAIANTENADLFISLHVNASSNTEAKGIETYYLDNTTDEAAIRLAARENATSRRNISDLQFILSDMAQTMKLEDSITLAHRLQASLVNGMSKSMAEVKDLGVKKALFHVLVGARMPSVLVEMFFITNRVESRAMGVPSYQDDMVDALYEGIQKYAQSNLMAKTL